MKRVIKNMMRLMVACVFAACSSSDDELMPGVTYLYEENPTTTDGEVLKNIQKAISKLYSTQAPCW